TKAKGYYPVSVSARTVVYKGLVLGTDLGAYYKDLEDPRVESAFAMVHQRFSTNTFPTWGLSHPFRMLAHNGEINTVRGNRNWLASRASDFHNEVWQGEEWLLKDLVDAHSSDSASLDQALELLVLSGRSPTHALAMLVPSAYGIDPTTSANVKAFHQFHECFSEPWDGPAALVMTNGMQVVASLDRNGLRPSRWKLTEDGVFALGSEVGIIRLDDTTVVQKGRLGPGEMLEVDVKRGRVRFDKEIKEELAAQQPYGAWLESHRIDLTAQAPLETEEPLDLLGLSQRQAAFGWTKEEVDMVLVPMLKTGQESVYSMGDDVSLSVLSERARLLSTYFRQLFAQVTNPPIDPIRERAVMSLDVVLGWQRNWLGETPDHASVVHLTSPFLYENELESLKQLEKFPHRVLDTTWPIADGSKGMQEALKQLCKDAETAVKEGVRILILSDRGVDHQRAVIPALLATGAVHHHLNTKQIRMRLSLVVDTGEARDTHQMACLFGYGASAICPHSAFETIRETLQQDKTARKPRLEGLTYATALSHFRSALEKGVLKIMSKMGISVLSSYTGAQIFEAVGIGAEVMDFAFAGTPSQIAGIGFEEIAREALERHAAGFATAVPDTGDEAPVALGDPGYFRSRRDGEMHAVTGPVIKNFHTFVKSGNKEDYQAYLDAQLENRPVALKDLLDFVPSEDGPIPIEKVEPVEDIRVRFTTAAMSLGAISPEAHEHLAIAMNRI
ncbi:MAG: glutamate synthase subunit alpha, partial [Verrucomicrobiales bacterium]|nr:glutamate synthase subunit alpha [Verrucomicrobiales bacterium]